MKRIKKIPYFSGGAVCLLLALLLTVSALPVMAPTPEKSEPPRTEREALSYTEPAVTERADQPVFTQDVAAEPFLGRETADETAARARLSSVGRALYDVVVPAFADIAAGERDSVVFRFLTEDLAALGIENRYVFPEGAEDQLLAAFSAEMELDGVLSAVLHDCPYELYWFDKTAGVSYQFSVEEHEEGYRYVNSFRIVYQVTPAYRSASYPDGSEERVDYARYTVDPAKTAATAFCLERAREIVAAAEGLSDYQRIRQYTDRICALTSYNSGVAEAGPAAGYGDPFQVTYVFDGDPTTRVVCEGYAKAFQLLCDLTEFNDPGVECYTVMGSMDGVAHMWNLVTMGNGATYLLDVTNSDVGTSGSGGGLFLAGADGSPTEGYRVTLAPGYSIFYEYREANVLSLWGSGADSPLWLSDRAYEPSEIFIYVPKLSYTGSAVSSGLPGSGASVLYSCDGGTDRNDRYTWSAGWYADENGTAGTVEIEPPRSVGSYWLRVRAVGTDVKEKYARVEILPAVLTVTDVITEEKIYDGSERVTVTMLTLTGSLPGEQVWALGGEGATPVADAGTHDRVILRSVILSGADANNYRVLTPCEVSAVAVIRPKPVTSPTLTLGETELEYNGQPLLPTLTLTDGTTVISPSEYEILGENNREAGSATVRVVDRPGGNYVLGETSASFTVLPRVPLYTLPENLTATEGQTLGELSLPAGFTWQDSPDTVVGTVGEQSFLVSYTPTDTRNERTLSNLTLTVRVLPRAEESRTVLQRIFYDPRFLAAYLGGAVILGGLLGLVGGIRYRRR